MKVVKTGVPGIWLEWWDVRGKNPRKITGELSAMLDEAFQEGQLHGISTAGFEIDRLYKIRKDEPLRKPAALSRRPRNKR